MARTDGRRFDALRRVRIQRAFTKFPPGSVLIETGETRVLCTASIEEGVPKWRQGKGEGWVTAEYEMLPGSTQERRSRNRAGKIDGRTQEIQRLIGRSLRSIVDMKKLGERTIWLDCDVIQADGGTRTASVNGAFVALSEAVNFLMKQGLITQSPLIDSVGAISVGLVGGKVLLDLCYVEDKDAEVDFNIVQTGAGRFVEVQGSAEHGTFTPAQMNKMIAVASKGIRQVLKIQTQAMAGMGRKRR